MILLASIFLFSPRASATGGLTGALNAISDEIGSGGDSGSGGSSSSQDGSSSSAGDSSGPSAASPEPASPVGPGGPEFGPADDPGTGAIDRRIVPAEHTPNMGETVVDPKTGGSTTTYYNPDGTRKVVKKDKDGHVLSEEFYPPGSDKPDVVKTKDPETGETTTTVTNKDGSKDVLVTNSDGFLVGETHVGGPRPSASVYDPESGNTTSSVRNPDGSRTIKTTDPDGNLISTEIIPPRGHGRPTATMRDPQTGKTVTSTRNGDGSRTVETKDKDGRVTGRTEEPAPGKGEAFVSTKDPRTGVTTTIHGTGADRAVSETRTWKGDDGREHTLVTDDGGAQTEVVRNPDGTTDTTTYDADNRKTEIRDGADGSRTVKTAVPEGSREKTTRPDGTVETVVKDGSGRTIRSSTTALDGSTVETDAGNGVKTESHETPAGGRFVKKTDREGNVEKTYYDEDGRVVYQEEERATEKAPGQRYFENELGGKFGEWDKLPDDLKKKFAASEGEIRERAEAELRRQAEKEARITEEAEWKKLQAERQKGYDKKYAEIQKEADAAAKRYEESLKKQEQWRERNEARAKLGEYSTKYQEALARGDEAEAKRIAREWDDYHDKTLDLFKMTPEEDAAAAKKQEVRDRVVQRVTSVARNASETDLMVTEALQDAKEKVTGKAQYLSIGAKMQEETKRTTRMADRERAFAAAKQAEIQRLLDDPKTTAEEREVLFSMRDASMAQEASASQMLSDNARLTALGYGIDAGMIVTGAGVTKLANAGVRNLAVAGARAGLIERGTAVAVGKGLTETGVVSLAGQGATRAATATAGKALGETAAAKVEAALTYDVGKGAATAADAAGTRILGETGVEAVKAGAAKVANAAATDVRDIPKALGYGKQGLADTAGAEAAAETAASTAAKSGARSEAAPAGESSRARGLAETWPDDAIPAPVESAPKPGLYGNKSMKADELADFALNPRVRAKAPPEAQKTFDLGTISERSRAGDAEAIARARMPWLQKPRVEREAFDSEVRSAIDEAAAMGDKWARRLQQELNSSNPKFDYRYDPGIKSAGLAPREGQTVILNPLRGGKLESPDRLASTLIHEYAHKYQGPVKWAAAEGEMASGSATKGTYNETRAFLAEAQFNNNLQNARLLNGKKFDDSALRELRTLMDADALQAAAPEQSFARGKAAA
ncbi:MAG TPA: hypothetical protein VL404_08750, partial [Candidatus Eisenbacteria bacterium]|nr:hypothetical protein [Candidatus Eisenbacteria bacterium]